MKKARFLALSAAIACGASSAFAQTVTNPGFESPDVTPTGFDRYSTTAFPGWSTGLSFIDESDLFVVGEDSNSMPVDPIGDQSLVIQFTSTSTSFSKVNAIYQSLGTLQSQAYSFDFDVGYRTGTGYEDPSDFQIGLAVDTTGNGLPNQELLYVTKSDVSSVATTGQTLTTVSGTTFDATGNGNVGNEFFFYIAARDDNVNSDRIGLVADNISVVPEPASYGFLLGLGCVSLLLIIRRRRSN